MAFSKGKSIKLLTKEQILEYYDQLDLFKMYFKDLKLPCVINSPFREDHNPSFGIRVADKFNNIQFMDFKTKEAGDIFKLLSLYWGMSFSEVLEKISYDINISNVDLIQLNSSRVKPNKIISNSKSILQCKVREWRDYDLEFWESYGISKKWLIFGDVYPVSIIFVIKDDKTIKISADKYAYAYVERKDKNVSLKIYQPFNDRFKWMNNNDSSVWDLWEKLPKNGDNLIITSSRKDALCIWENTGIPSVSLQSETCLPKIHVVNQLKERFKNVYVLYDNDFNKEYNTGLIEGKKISELFDITQLILPENLKAKDSSDLCKMYGRHKLKDTIELLIKK